MKPLIACAILCVPLLIAACASPPSGAGRDFLGNLYPPECADVSDIRVPIIEVDHVILWEHGAAAGLYGGWSPMHYVMVRRGLDPVRRADVIHHELCHEKRWRLTGGPEWHP